MIPLTFESLLHYFNDRRKQTAEIENKTEQITVILTIDSIDFPLFIKIIEEGPLLQMLVFIPATLEKEKYSEMARLLHLLNREMDVPGFGMDESSGTVFYRLALAADKSEINETILDLYLNTVEKICHSFTPVIQRLSKGELTFEQVYQHSVASRE